MKTILFGSLFFLGNFLFAGTSHKNRVYPSYGLEFEFRPVEGNYKREYPGFLSNVPPQNPNGFGLVPTRDENGRFDTTKGTIVVHRGPRSFPTYWQDHAGVNNSGNIEVVSDPVFPDEKKIKSSENRSGEYLHQHWKGVANDLRRVRQNAVNQGMTPSSFHVHFRVPKNPFREAGVSDEDFMAYFSGVISEYVYHNRAPNVGDRVFVNYSMIRPPPHMMRNRSVLRIMSDDDERYINPIYKKEGKEWDIEIRGGRTKIDTLDTAMQRILTDFSDIKAFARKVKGMHRQQMLFYGYGKDPVRELNHFRQSVGKAPLTADQAEVARNLTLIGANYYEFFDILNPKMTRNDQVHMPFMGKEYDPMLTEADREKVRQANLKFLDGFNDLVEKTKKSDIKLIVRKDDDGDDYVYGDWDNPKTHEKLHAYRHLLQEWSKKKVSDLSMASIKRAKPENARIENMKEQFDKPGFLHFIINQARQGKPLAELERDPDYSRKNKYYPNDYAREALGLISAEQLKKALVLGEITKGEAEFCKAFSKMKEKISSRRGPIQQQRKGPPFVTKVLK